MIFNQWCLTNSTKVNLLKSEIENDWKYYKPVAKMT